MKNLIDWQPQLIPAQYTQISATQRRARMAGYIIVGAILGSFIPFAMFITFPLLFVATPLALYWGWRARQGALNMQQIGELLHLDHGSTPVRFSSSMLRIDPDDEVTDHGYLWGSVGSPGAVQVHLASLDVTSTSGSGSDQHTTTAISLVAGAPVAMPVTFLRVERRRAGKQALRGVLGALGAGRKSWSVPTQEITTESVSFNERWRVLVHRDDDPIQALRMFTPEIIVAFTDNRVPFEDELVYHDGHIVIVQMRDDILLVRQIDHVLYTLMQTARFARVLAQEGGHRVGSS